MNFHFHLFPQKNISSNRNLYYSTENGINIDCKSLGIAPCQREIQYNKLNTGGNNPSVTRSMIMSQSVRNGKSNIIYKNIASTTTTSSSTTYPYSLLWYDFQDTTTIYNALGFNPHQNDDIKIIMNKATNSINTINLMSIYENYSYTLYKNVSVGSKKYNSLFTVNNISTGLITDVSNVNLSSGFGCFLVFSPNTPVDITGLSFPPELWCKTKTDGAFTFNSYSGIRNIGNETNNTTGASSFDVSVPLNTPTPVILYNEFNTLTNTYNEYVNSVNVSSFTSLFYGDTPGSIFLGNNTNGYFGSNYYYEFVIYPSALTDTNRKLVEGWLAWKYNINGNLPSNHPYYTFAPSVNPIQ